MARVRTFWGIHLTNKILGFNKKYDDILSLIVPILSNYYHKFSCFWNSDVTICDIRIQELAVN